MFQFSTLAKPHLNALGIKERGKGGLMVSVLVLGVSGLGWSPSWGHCVVFFGKTLNSHSASLHLNPNP